MMRRRYLILALLLVPLAAWALVGQHYGARVQATHTIDQTGDTAKVYRVSQFTARDGFAYSDTVAFNDTTIVTWTSPMMVRRVTVAASIDTTKVDTLHVDLGTNKTGVVWTVPNISTLVGTGARAAYIDSMVARFNAVSTLADTVVAQDSVTYIKLVGLIAQDALEGDARWTIDVTNASTNMVQADSTFTTVNMVCDSMVAALEDSTTIADSIVAAVSGAAGSAADTAYTVTGRAGYDFLLSPIDTAQDTTLVTSAATSSSYDTTTINLPIRMYEQGWNSLNGEVVFPASATTTKGYGTLDSVWFYLYKTWVTSNTAVIVAADSGTIPRTWQVRLDSKADSVFGNGPMYIRIIQMDTATDTSGSRTHTVDWGLTATE